MKIKFLIILMVSALCSSAQGFKPARFTDIEKVLKNESDTLFVLNFWATWCKPCVAELPYFDELTSKYKDEKFKVILISMDFKSEIESKLPSFLEKKQLKSEVWWFNEEKQGEFMEKIEREWYGAIPFTLILKGDNQFRYWKEGQWEKEELFEKVAEIL